MNPYNAPFACWKSCQQVANTPPTVTPMSAHAMWAEHARLGYKPLAIVRKLAAAGFTLAQILEAAPNE